MARMTVYFGTFKAYEEYYAIADTAEGCKAMLWAMYKRNFYDRPTKQDKEDFEETVRIEKVTNFDLSLGIGINTADYEVRENYKKLTRAVK